MALKAHALVTLATVKDLLQITVSDYDTKLETLINMVSRMMIQEIGHNPVYTSYSSISLDGSGINMLLIPNYPIVAVSSIKENDTSLTEDTDFIIYPDEGYLLKIAADITAGYPTDVWAEGNRNVVISYTAGYKFTSIVYFDSGSEEPKIADTLVGATSAAEGVVSKIVLTTGAWSYKYGTFFYDSGVWGDGDAGGWIEFSSVTGTFEDNENIDIDGGNSNVLTVDHPDNTLWMPDDIQLACVKQVGIENKRFGSEDWDQTSVAFPDGSISRNIVELHPQVKEVCRKYRRLTL